MFYNITCATPKLFDSNDVDGQRALRLRDKLKLHTMIYLFSGWVLIIKDVTFACVSLGMRQVDSPNLHPLPSRMKDIILLCMTRH